MTEVAALGLAVVLIAVGLAGTVLPALPGPMLVFGGILLAAWTNDFTRIGILTVIVAGAMTAAAHAVDLASSAFGVRRAGASGRAMLGASLGALAGLFFGLPGLLVGPFAGAMLGELTVHRELGRAGRAGLAAWLGFVAGTAAKVALVMSMVAVAAFAYFF